MADFLLLYKLSFDLVDLGFHSDPIQVSDKCNSEKWAVIWGSELAQGFKDRDSKAGI